MKQREKLSRIDADVRAQLSESSPSAEDRALVDKCVSELKPIVGQLGSNWCLELFGSVSNGFGTRFSDIDATCTRAGPPPEEEAESAGSLLSERLCPLLKEHPQFSIVQEVLTAKVPIVKLRYAQSLDIDLSCQNRQPLQNTRLLRAYATFNEKVRDLGVAVKLWAKAAGVCGACKGNLSSYAFTLLVIYFMQVHPEVQLPCLPTAAFADGAGREGQKAVAAALASWSCSLSVAQLLLKFFEFYWLTFAWGQEVVSPRVGFRLPAIEEVYEKLRGRWYPRIHVEDPYLLERNLNCVLGEAEEVQLRNAFMDAFTHIQQGIAPPGLRRTDESATPPPSPLVVPAQDPEVDEAPALSDGNMAASISRGGGDKTDERSGSQDLSQESTACESLGGGSQCSDDERSVAQAGSEEPAKFTPSVQASESETHSASGCRHSELSSVAATFSGTAVVKYAADGPSPTTTAESNEPPTDVSRQRVHSAPDPGRKACDEVGLSARPKSRSFTAKSTSSLFAKVSKACMERQNYQ